MVTFLMRTSLVGDWLGLKLPIGIYITGQALLPDLCTCRRDRAAGTDQLASYQQVYMIIVHPVGSYF